MPNPFQSRWHQWLSKRFSVEHRKQLRQKDVLIFLYQQGYIFVSLVLLSFIAGVNYANNLILGFCFLMSAILCISFYITFKQLHDLNIEFLSPNVGQVGQPLSLKIIFTQSSARPRYLWLKYQQHSQILLLQHTHEVLELEFMPQQRGEWHYPVVQMYSVYPFGLVRAWTYFYLKKLCWIAPKALDLEQNRILPSQNEQHDLDEFRDLREFQQGDRLQAISWKHVAQGQGLQVKVFEQQYAPPHMQIAYADMPVQGHEAKLSAMMGRIQHCELQQQAYSVSLPQAHLPFGLGEQHLQQAKKLLAQA